MFTSESELESESGFRVLLESELESEIPGIVHCSTNGNWLLSTYNLHLATHRINPLKLPLQMQWISLGVLTVYI